jgi:hypothetical protein
MTFEQQLSGGLPVVGVLRQAWLLCIVATELVRCMSKLGKGSTHDTIHHARPGALRHGCDQKLEQQLSGGLPMVGAMCHSPGLLAPWLLHTDLLILRGKARAQQRKGLYPPGVWETHLTTSLAISTHSMALPTPGCQQCAGLLHCPFTRVPSHWLGYRQYACTSAAACGSQHGLLSMQP